MRIKKRNGFVFIETIIVIAVLTTALVLLYSMFTAVLNQEKKRASFEDVAYLYRTYYLTEFYNDVAKRSMTYGINDKNPIVSMPLTTDAAKDFIPEEELGFYEQLIGSSFGITNIYLAGDNIGDLEDCDRSKTSCDVIEDLAGSNWKTYLKTLYKNNTGYRMIGVYGNGDGKHGSGCFDVFEGTLTSNDSTCNFYYSSVPIRNYRLPDEPVLNNGLIPVVYEDNKWVKADTTKKWYDYDNQWWANAVTVSSATRNSYNSAAIGTEIKMSDIETMWVWVPRYEYNYKRLLISSYYGGTSSDRGTKTEPKGIEINFISKETITPSSGDFTIHDAFWWDNNNNGKKDNGEQLSGIWVAKFEMSAANPTSNTLQSPIVKPNITSWRGNQIATFWTAIHNNMNGKDNIYGLTNSDAHLMKNMEWGAVAYLSQSIYGKYGNEIYQGVDKEVAINNCNSYITGIGGDTVSAADSSTTCTTNTYETEKGQAASTTGNVYGIYDMSGGAHEYVMGVMKENTNTEPAVGYNEYQNSGWSGRAYVDENWINYTGIYGRLGDDPKTKDVVEGIGSKYYDLYTYSTSTTVTEERAHKGDATFETKGWYSDNTYFVNAKYSFFRRGGSYSSRTNAGVFSMDSNFSTASPIISGRPVLVQIK